MFLLGNKKLNTVPGTEQSYEPEDEDFGETN